EGVAPPLPVDLHEGGALEHHLEPGVRAALADRGVPGRGGDRGPGLDEVRDDLVRQSREQVDVGQRLRECPMGHEASLPRASRTPRWPQSCAMAMGRWTTSPPHVAAVPARTPSAARLAELVGE